MQQRGRSFTLEPRYTVHGCLRRPTTSRPRRGDIHRRKVYPGPPRRSERRRLGPAQHYAIPWLALHSRALRLRLQRTCGWTEHRVGSRGLCSPRELVEAGRALHPALGQGVLVLLVRCQWHEPEARGCGPPIQTATSSNGRTDQKRQNVDE